jgi:hypothetical protein
MSEKRDNQRDKILVWLQMRGQRGVLNTELNEICLRYGARIHELRAAGHNITTHKLDDSRYRFVIEEQVSLGSVARPAGSHEVSAQRPVQAAAEQQRLFA